LIDIYLFFVGEEDCLSFGGEVKEQCHSRLETFMTIVL